MLLARIYEAFLLTCPKCGTLVRTIAFVAEAASVSRVLKHFGEPATPPPLPARGAPSEQNDD